MRKLKVEVFSRRNILGRKRHYFRVKAGNYEIIASSEAYQNKLDCVKTARLVMSGNFEQSIVFIGAN